jgi:hypothetical protein
MRPGLTTKIFTYADPTFMEEARRRLWVHAAVSNSVSKMSSRYPAENPVFDKLLLTTAVQ